MSHADFSALATSWHDFYLTAGAAAATLVGLLFVGLSINLDAVTADEGSGLRLLAEQAFSNFLFVLLIALFVLIPNQDAISLTIELSVVGTLGVLRVARRWRSFGRRGDRFGDRLYLFRRLGIPGLASAGLVVVAVFVSVHPISAFFWLLSVVLVYL